MGLKTPKQKARVFQMRQQQWKRDRQQTTRSCGKIRYGTELDAKIALASTRRGAVALPLPRRNVAITCVLNAMDTI
ncbi:hypothetical protein G1C96_0143 [Bifidobacterium sp. DSM 109958]|uniref:Uncharacterized protein n=1 Tax=Bifidobacterium moraviense TaxID=2675323 RepID=A0A7Y0F1W8_9BIFI|nr:hypothetical protein [Bifidobacterium sp. DSM 109958]NMM99566.1 hypothetical protein [Bifidobacterium sp. DSM 109958]